jgi:hypothetical protein
MVKCVFLSYFKYNIDDENIKEVDKVDEEEYFVHYSFLQ